MTDAKEEEDVIEVVNLNSKILRKNFVDRYNLMCEINDWRNVTEMHEKFIFGASRVIHNNNTYRMILFR